MVDLSSLDSNKYEAIIRQKNRVIRAARNLDQTATAAISGNIAQNRQKIDEFGEIAVKRLKQSYRKDFSDEDINLIISGYQSGKTTITLAEQFNCCKTTINKLLRSHGINVTKAKAQAKLDLNVVIAMYKERYTIDEIAKRFDVSSYTVNRYLRSNGVKIRNRWDYVTK